MKDKILIAAIAIIGVLTVFNTYKILSDDDSTSARSRIVANRAEKAPAKNDSKANINASPNFDPISEQDKNKPVGPSTSVSFKKMEHDFGNISQGSTNDYVFTFTNTGKEPLIISNAKGSCGCTVPRWPKEPIAPGESGEIEIIYKPGKQKNQQTKSITVTANTQPEKTILKVKANVLEVAG